MVYKKSTLSKSIYQNWIYTNMKSSRDTDMIMAMSKYQLNHPDRKHHVKKYMADRINQLLNEKEVEKSTDMNEENKSE